jgi:hypothetical protein
MRLETLFLNNCIVIIYTIIFKINKYYKIYLLIVLYCFYHTQYLILLLLLVYYVYLKYAITMYNIVEIFTQSQ